MSSLENAAASGVFPGAGADERRVLARGVTLPRSNRNWLTCSTLSRRTANADAEVANGRALRDERGSRVQRPR
jgi:hypothetical protein